LEEYEEHPQQAISNVSNELGARMEKLVYILGDKEKENAFNLAEEMYRNSFHSNQSSIFEYHYERFSEGKRLSSYFNSDGGNSFRAQVEDYQEILEVKKIKDIHVCQSGMPFWKNLLSVIFSTPLWVVGLILTSAPAFISNKITGSKVKDQAFVGPVKISLGILLYSVYFSLATILFISLCGWYGLILTIILMSLAYFVARTHFHHLNTWESIYFMITNRVSMDELRLKRNSIIDQMHQIIFDENSIANAN
jgi:hypothetical protein